MWIQKPSAFLTLLFILAIGVELSFAQSQRGIRSVDFYNFTYKVDGRAKVTLKNGRYKKKYFPDSNALFTSKLAVLKYADFDGDGEEEAVVLIQSRDSGGSSHGDNDYFVFAYRAGKPRQIFHEYREGPEGLCLKNRSIIITAEAWEGISVPHCCPPFTETKIYRWRGSHFALVKTYRQKNYPGQNPQQFKQARRCENFR
jgi:hypothetical protein